MQLPGTATGPLTASANRMMISTSGWGIQLFRLAGWNPSVLQQCHLDFGSDITASITLHRWQFKRTDVSILRLFYPSTQHSTTGCPSKRTCQFSRLFYPSIQYFNDDTFENRCYFNDGNTEGCYCNDNNFEKFLLYQARGDLEAGQEGRHEHIGKVGGPEEDHIVVPHPEPN